MTRSHWLVSLQLLLIAVIVLLSVPGIGRLTGSAALPGRAVLCLVAIAVAGSLAVWALASMTRGTFRVMPEPGDSAHLTTRGPYRWIRHPMYSSVLLGCAGLVGLSPWWPLALLAWLALSAILLMKIRHEERLLRQRYADYTDYADATARLLPGLW